MANVIPPSRPARGAVVKSLPAGTLLYRVHESRFPATVFNPGPSHRYYGGGRFDGTDDDNYGFCYAGSSPQAAVSEALLRDLAPDDSGPRILQRARVSGRRISPVEILSDVSVVSLLTGSDLGAVSQDTWLTTAPPAQYAQTRHWVHWIRSHTPPIAGAQWRSLREPDESAIVLFADRCPPGLLQVQSTHFLAGDAGDFDHYSGRDWLDKVLEEYAAVLV